MSLSQERNRRRVAQKADSSPIRLLNEDSDR